MEGAVDVRAPESCRTARSTALSKWIGNKSLKGFCCNVKNVFARCTCDLDPILQAARDRGGERG